MKLTGSARVISSELRKRGPAVPPAAYPPKGVKREMLDYQLAALYQLAKPYDQLGACFLEIGTGHAGSGFVLAKAAPSAQILSLTMSAGEAAAAMLLWRKHGLRKIESKVGSSFQLLERTLYGGDPPRFDLIFVDGDHNAFGRDLPWFNLVRTGGLFVCHVYSPPGCRVASPVVFTGLNMMADKLGRPFDVLIVDDEHIGMAGFFKRDGDYI